MFESFTKTRLCFNAPSGTFHAKIPFKEFKLLRERKALLENTNDEVSDLPEVLEFLQKINENQSSSESVRLLQFKEFSDLRLYKSGLDSFIYSSAKLLLIEGKKGWKTNFAKYLNDLYLEEVFLVFTYMQIAQLVVLLKFCVKHCNYLAWKLFTMFLGS